LVWSFDSANFLSTIPMKECCVYQPGAEALPERMAPGAADAAKAAVAWVKEAAELCLKQRASAMITAPSEQGIDCARRCAFLSARRSCFPNWPERRERE
jgi:4-hydroxy-L-threonine phosphate dehydrogenase PdxA